MHTVLGVSNETAADGKKFGLVCLFVDQYVLPGQIIVRQRGTQFHAGQNVSETFLLVSLGVRGAYVDTNFMASSLRMRSTRSDMFGSISSLDDQQTIDIENTFPG